MHSDNRGRPIGLRSHINLGSMPLAHEGRRKKGRRESSNVAQPDLPCHTCGITKFHAHGLYGLTYEAQLYDLWFPPQGCLPTARYSIVCILLDGQTVVYLHTFFPFYRCSETSTSYISPWWRFKFHRFILF